MTPSLPVEPQSARQTSMPPGAAGQAGARRRSGYLFGIPLGDLGWFATLLMSLVSGFVAFFLATFLGIAGVMTYNMALHRAADFAISYRLIGLPVGLLVLVVATAYLVTLRVKRMLRRAAPATENGR